MRIQKNPERHSKFEIWFLFEIIVHTAIMLPGAQSKARKQRSRDNDVADDVLDEREYAGLSRVRRNRQRKYALSFLLEHIRQSVLRFTFFSQGNLAGSVLLDPKFAEQMH